MGMDEPNAWQDGQRRRGSRLASIGAAAVGPAIVLVALAAALVPRSEETSPRRIVVASTDPPSSVARPQAPVPRGPKVDYTIDLKTGVMTPLPKVITRSLGRSDESSQYAASPDGTLLAYVGIGDEGSAQIFIAGIDGTGVRQVTHDSRRATSPAWSPDATKIAYEAYGGRNVQNLFVLDVSTGKSRQITDEKRAVWSPQFAPDGSSLVFTAGPDCCPVLRTVPVAGGKSRLLIGPGEGVTDAGNGSLSPDGSVVTFLGGGWPESFDGHCGPCRLVAKADGTDRRVIPGFEASPAGTWSPDGDRIVVSDGFGRDILVVEIATGIASRVARGKRAVWLDGHTLLVEVS